MGWRGGGARGGWVGGCIPHMKIFNKPNLRFMFCVCALCFQRHFFYLFVCVCVCGGGGGRGGRGCRGVVKI